MSREWEGRVGREAKSSADHHHGIDLAFFRRVRATAKQMCTGGIAENRE